VLDPHEGFHDARVYCRVLGNLGCVCGFHWLAPLLMIAYSRKSLRHASANFALIAIFEAGPIREIFMEPIRKMGRWRKAALH
jgi:hypothetical protein